MISIFAPAKLNLYLNVSQPIPDGKYKNYHNLDSLVCFANIGDNLIIDATENNFSTKGEFASLLNGENSIIKAKNLLEEYTGKDLKANIILEKNLPIASGIGGGSSDAAAALIALNQLYSLNCSNDILKEIAEKIGADVPVCIDKKSIIMRGIGNEFIACKPLPKFWVILANPLIECPTSFIYKKFDETLKDHSFKEVSELKSDNLIDFITELKKTKNDLEPIAMHEFSQIKELLAVLNDLPNCLLARMSGSGATCFAIFANEYTSKIALKELKEIYKNKPLWAKNGEII